MPNYSTIPDSDTVIYLGHSANVPLIRRSSELVDGLEPHGYILLAGHGAAVLGAAAAVRGCTQGGASGWVPGGWYTGY